MSNQGKKSIVIEKSLHLENATVLSINYTSADRPSLTEIVLVGDKTLIRVSRDNGKTWNKQGEWLNSRRVKEKIYNRYGLSYYLDPDNGMLIEFFMELEKPPREMTFGPDADKDPLEFRTKKIYYRLSRDQGKTWGPEKQLIQKGSGYDQTHWAKGVYYGRNSADFTTLRIIKLPDGTLIMPVWISFLGKDGKMVKYPDRFGIILWPSISSACMRGRWRDDLSDIDWEMSEQIIVPEYMSYSVDEPAITLLDDGNLLVVMRGDTTGRQVMPSVKFFSVSQDGGRTWSPAMPLTYPDGSFVYSPASLPDLFRSSKNGRVYLIANILPGPTRQCDPRYPLQIAEVDQKNFWVFQDTVTVIDDRQPHHPKFVRFSNWARIEDRETGNQVLYMTESRIDSMFDSIFPGGTFSPHSFRYDIRLPD